MIEPLLLRDEQAPPGLVVVRLGPRSLEDPMLIRSIGQNGSIVTTELLRDVFRLVEAAGQLKRSG